MSAALEALKLARKPPKLSTFLTLHYKSGREGYVNYMEGTEALHNWLTLNSSIQYFVDFPVIPGCSGNLTNYVTNRLADILTGDKPSKQYLKESAKWRDAIVSYHIHTMQDSYI